MGKICFPLGKIEFWTHWEFCAYHRIFEIRKGREYLYQLFDVLPKQTTCEVKAIQVYMFTFSSDFMMFKISCLSFRWRFFPYQLSHRYVMKMCCQPITILGYTSQSRKFEKFINIHLNKKLRWRVEQVQITSIINSDRISGYFCSDTVFI